MSHCRGFALGNQMPNLKSCASVLGKCGICQAHGILQAACTGKLYLRKVRCCRGVCHMPPGKPALSQCKTRDSGLPWRWAGGSTCCCWMCPWHGIMRFPQQACQKHPLMFTSKYLLLTLSGAPSLDGGGSVTDCIWHFYTGCWPL